MKTAENFAREIQQTSERRLCSRDNPWLDIVKMIEQRDEELLKPDQSTDKLIEDLRNILEWNHQATGSNGHCPWCDAEDYPIDKKGNRIESGDAEEYRCDHESDCAVTMIEEVLTNHMKRYQK